MHSRGSITYLPVSSATCGGSYGIGGRLQRHSRRNTRFLRVADTTTQFEQRQPLSHLLYVLRENGEADDNAAIRRCPRLGDWFGHTARPLSISRIVVAEDDGPRPTTVRGRGNRRPRRASRERVFRSADEKR